MAKSKAANEEARKSNKILAVILISVITVFAVIGYIMLKGEKQITPESSDNTVVYKQYVFFRTGNYWQSLILLTNKVTGKSQVYNMSFHYTPYDVMNITSPKNSISEPTAPKILIINAKQIYLTMDPEDPSSVAIAGVEIAKIIGPIYQVPLKASITRASNKTDAPIITCANVTATQKVLELRLSNETGIFEEKGCIIVKGTNTDELIKAAEKLTFELLKVL